MRSIVAAVAGVVAIALFFGFIGFAILDASDSLATEVARTIETFKPVDSEGGFNLLFVDGGPNDVADGIRIVLAGVLVGGFPVALLVMAVAWRYRGSGRRWSAVWAQVFLAGFVFQLSHVCLVSLLPLGCWRSMRAAARTDARLLLL